MFERGKECYIIDILDDGKKTRDEKITILDDLCERYFPPLEGDKVTFIGSTFLSYGSPKPYLNHCIVLNSCSKIKGAENTEIETYNSEKSIVSVERPYSTRRSGHHYWIQYIWF